MSILLLQGSTRENGNTEQLVRLVLEGIPYREIALREKRIMPIRDQRHEEGGFDAVDDDYDEVILEVLQHETLVFATPVYWYGVSGVMKNFIDRWSQSLRDPRFDFKQAMSQKKAYVIVTGGDNPRIKAMPLIQQLKYTFDFMGMPLEGYLIGKASKPGEILQDTRAVCEAGWLNASLQSLVIPS
ncbi:flavodoxin family protein [Paenibacillus sp. A14]|uniref:flavodoxin family protein n=1 Tax=Paenibacillus sp. A14 TaxID=3119820 RepID=UPI002FDF723E